MAHIGAVILAAGESSRFGRAKQLVKVSGQILIEKVITAADQTGCRPILVVIGSEADKLRAAIPNNAVVVENGDWRKGIGSSIRAGLQQLTTHSPEIEATILLVCDQPFVTATTIRGLIDQWASARKPIVASAYADTLGVPVLFDRSCFEELLQVEDDTGAKPIILKNPGRVANVPFPAGSVDIDTESDYAGIEPHS
jgi:molybdenum cofactor cytidylyltransferase